MNSLIVIPIVVKTIIFRGAARDRSAPFIGACGDVAALLKSFDNDHERTRHDSLALLLTSGARKLSFRPPDLRINGKASCWISEICGKCGDFVNEKFNGTVSAENFAKCEKERRARIVRHV